MFPLLVIFFSSLIISSHSLPANLFNRLPRQQDSCGSANRLAAAAAIPTAYASNPPLTTLAYFEAVGFADTCILTMLVRPAFNKT